VRDVVFEKDYSLTPSMCSTVTDADQLAQVQEIEPGSSHIEGVSS
jgi:hypothetical protein